MVAKWPCAAALVEMYSVLTRLPGDIQLDPIDASRLLTERLLAPPTLSASATGSLPGTLGRLGIAGGAVYDALVGIAAVEHGAVVATRDEQAPATYEAVGAQAPVVP